MTETITAPPRETPAVQQRSAASWLPRMLVESALIVFSVLLALGVDGWSNSREHRKQARAAEAEVLQELRSNRDLVEQARQYHGGLLRLIASSREQGDALTMRDFDRGFVSPAQISHTAWASASETGALSHMEYSTVLRLSRIYAQQERYTEQARSIGQLLYAEIYHNGTESIVANIRNLAGLISTFVYREEELLKMYDATLSPGTE